MNPILQMLNRNQPAPNQQINNMDPAQAKNQVLNIIRNMNPAQKAMLNKALPTIERVARAKGIDTSELSELQSRM